MAPDRPAALVTGSASGIGRAAALRLARAGYDVAINYSRSEAAARQTLAELDRRATWTPMQRNVTEEDVAETIFSLVSSNPFVTGETIVIDGGYAATT
jgi:NAD(P)-dependent dehydrogenase (short-subunit alcohol dehydrogenase family)